mgnify:CR=1 FL=1
MSNMSYCRFYNTEMDLRDCYNDMDLDADASEQEKRARKRLIELACNIALEYGDEVDRNIEESDE